MGFITLIWPCQVCDKHGSLVWFSSPLKYKFDEMSNYVKAQKLILWFIVMLTSFHMNLGKIVNLPIIFFLHNWVYWMPKIFFDRLFETDPLNSMSEFVWVFLVVYNEKNRSFQFSIILKVHCRKKNWEIYFNHEIL